MDLNSCPEMGYFTDNSYWVRMPEKWGKFVFSWAWSGRLVRFPLFAHIFDLTIFLTDPTQQLSSKNFSLSALEGQSRPGRAFLAIFYDFRPLNAFFARFSTLKTIAMLEFGVFHQTLDISIFFSQIVDVLTPELACFRRKNANFSLLGAIWPLLSSMMRQV